MGGFRPDTLADVAEPPAFEHLVHRGAVMAAAHQAARPKAVPCGSYA
jgi:hypothetical protein